MATLTSEYVMEQFEQMKGRAEKQEETMKEMKAEMLEIEKKHEDEGMQHLADKYKSELLAKDLMLEIEKLKLELKDKEVEKALVENMKKEIEKMKEDAKSKDPEKEERKDDIKGFHWETHEARHSGYSPSIFLCASQARGVHRNTQRGQRIRRWK